MAEHSLSVARPLATAFIAVVCWRGLMRTRFMFSPFYSAGGLFVLAYIGLVISMMPYLVPPIHHRVERGSCSVLAALRADRHRGSSALILGYTVFVYYTFRGKVRADEGYH